MTRPSVAALVAVLVLVACGPPPTPAPPPPTTAAPRYEECPRTGPFTCSLWTMHDTYAGTTDATGYAQTTEPPTFIYINLTLERYDGGEHPWTGIAIYRGPAGGVKQAHEYRSPLIGCLPGTYRWHMEVSYTGNRTTYTTTSAPFVLR